MKIGIITYHKSHNYGTVLQAFALYSIIKRQGYNVEMIDYWPEYRKGQYDLIRWSSYFKGDSPISSRIKTFIKRAICFPERWARYRKFRKFIQTRYTSSNYTYTSGEQIPDNFDVIFFGSDQIWRYNKAKNNLGFDDVYFGSFPKSTKVKKVSYAASMGVEVLDDVGIKLFKKNIKNFHSISVREDSLLKLVTHVSSATPTHVLDPVFLLPKSEWGNMFKKRKLKRRYLLFYQLMPSNEAVALANKIAKEKQLDIVQLRGYVRPFDWLNGVNTVAGPIDFLSLIANADYVISTSFHGVAFSIIFQKQFSALGFNNNNSRVKSLLTSLGIERLMLENEDASYQEDIDYSMVNLRLKKMISNSLLFLKSNLPTRK